MRVFSGLILVLIEKIVPLALAVFAIIKVAKAQSISKKSKIILSIIIFKHSLNFIQFRNSMFRLIAP